MPLETLVCVRSGPHHQSQAERLRANLEALIAHHEIEAEKYLQKGA